MKNVVRVIYALMSIILVYIGFEWIPKWFTDTNTLILIAFIIGILVSICFLQIIYAFPNFRAFRIRKTSDFSNPLLQFVIKMMIPLSGISIITLLCIHFLLRKPVIDFKDGKAAMALKGDIRTISTHRNVKYEVQVSFLTDDNKKINTYDMLFKEELKYIETLDSLPIVYSETNPKKIAIITTNQKLKRIKAGK